MFKIVGLPLATLFCSLLSLMPPTSSLAAPPSFLLRSGQPRSLLRPLTRLFSSSTADGIASDHRLASLRGILADHNLTALIVPSSDPHLSEYVAPAYERRRHVSGFDGSAGTAVVTESEALLWTDARYWTQAADQLPKSFKLMKAGEEGTLTVQKFFKGGRVGYDPLLHPPSFVKELEKEVKLAGGEAVPTPSNLVDEIWPDRPPLPSTPFRVHPEKYAGASAADKIKAVRRSLSEAGATMAVYPALDEVAYLFNLRAADVECNPVGTAYAAVTSDKCFLYCDADIKVQDDDVSAHLKKAGVTLRPYDDVFADIEAHAAEASSNRVWIDPSNSNHRLSSALPADKVHSKTSHVTKMKCIKNEKELEGMREAHRIDGAAMARFCSWLFRVVPERSVGECEIDEKLLEERAGASGGTFFEASFPTIAGAGPNGAIIHYRANGETEGEVAMNTPVLIDSGGQYLMGTTDVTRTWCVGDPGDEFKDRFTRVLKGNINLDSLQFPAGTPGCLIDAFARKALWDAGLDYGHGTGHGVGAALNVHEGPQSISPRPGNTEGLKTGMVCSNEPGFYKVGEYGIRIENLLVVVEKRKAVKGERKQFLGFDALTMIPIQKSLIKLELMESWELDWLDAYHAKVWENVSDRLEEGEEAWTWLKSACAPIARSKV